MPGRAHLVVSDLDQAVRMRSHARAEHAGDLLGAEADSKHRLSALQRGALDPVELGADAGVMVVVRALRSPEHDRGDVSGQILGQRISVARPAAVELEAPGGEAFSDLAGVGLRLWKTAIILSGIAYAPPRAMEGSPARPHERDVDLTAVSHRQGAAAPACGTGRGPRSVFYPPPCARSIAT